MFHLIFVNHFVTLTHNPPRDAFDPPRDAFDPPRDAFDVEQIKCSLLVPDVNSTLAPGALTFNPPSHL